MELTLYTMWPVKSLMDTGKKSINLSLPILLHCECRITKTFIDTVIKIIADVRPFIDLFLAVQWLKYGFCSMPYILRHVPKETSIFDVHKTKISEGEEKH